MGGLPAPDRRRPYVRSTLLATVILLNGCGGGGRPDAKQEASPTTTSAVSTSRGPSAAPRWETVTTFEGQASTTTAQFSILPRAIQWRVRWKCEAGALQVTGIPAFKKKPVLIDGTCPKEEVAYAIQTGARQLKVEATGPWKLIVDQQVDTPIDEAPLPAMATADVLRGGEFYDIEKKGKGSARLYRMPDGSRVLRLENFEVTQNTDLFVWLSEAGSPRTSAEVVDAAYVQLANLRSTLGSQNYVVPPEIPTEKIRSVVIWCEPIRIAYAAAPLNAS